MTIRKQIEKTLKSLNIKADIYWIDFKDGSSHYDVQGKDSTEALKLHEKAVEFTDDIRRCVTWAENNNGLCLFFVK